MKTSCGILIINQCEEILLGHATGKTYWDIPKGELQSDETPIQCAIRECKEETALIVQPEVLKEIGLLPYHDKKRLYLFLTYVRKEDIDLKRLICTSFFEHPYTKKNTPEIDGFKWVNLTEYEVDKYCSLSMARLLKKLLERIRPGSDR